MFINKTANTANATVIYNVINSRSLIYMFEGMLLVLGCVIGTIFIIKDVIAGAIFFGLIVVVMALYPVFFKSTLKRAVGKAMAKSPIHDESSANTFTFNEEGIHIESSKNEDKVSSLDIKYELLSKVVEYKEYLFIYTGVNVAYTLDGNKMTEGSYEDLKAFLKNRLNNKYNIRKNMFF